MVFQKCKDDEAIDWLYCEAVRYLDEDGHPSRDYFCARKDEGRDEIVATSCWV